MSIASRDERRDSIAPPTTDRARHRWPGARGRRRSEQPPTPSRSGRGDDRTVRRRRSAVRQHRRAAGGHGARASTTRRGRAAFDLLLFSVIRTVRLVVPSMRARGGGAILVGTSSSVKEPIAEPGAVERAARRRCRRWPRRCRSSWRRDRSASTADSRAGSRPIASVTSTRSTPGRRGSRATSRPKRSAATIPLGRYGDARRVRPRRRVPALRRRVVHDRRATVQVDGGLDQGSC